MNQLHDCLDSGLADILTDCEWLIDSLNDLLIQ